MKIVTLVGARPQFIKSAAFSRALHGAHEEILLHTGQHYDANMSQVFFDELHMADPKYNLGIGSGSHAQQTAYMMLGIEGVLLKEKPDILVVFGDTNSTLAGALVASKMNIPIVHIEAGLRAFLRYVPEELNRIVTDHLSTLNFTPSENGRKWLAEEGIVNGVFNVGDIMYDSLLFYSKLANEKPFKYYFDRLVSLCGRLPYELLQNGWYLSTIHRQENTDSIDKYEQILEALNSLNLPVVMPLHPRTQKLIPKEDLAFRFPNVLFVEPLSYVDALYFCGNAKKVITDSGGLHKESYLLHIPSVVIANNSCWIETLEGNWATLSTPNKNEIIEKVMNTQIDEKKWELHYGNGDAAENIVKILESLYK
ncbi:TPA: UDP-N-acetylglucosamine 2-epimerase (non-hydrolyzing) [Candidatus Uhrbacteria bacterium]|nr:UDP-N-acetylglucosamine 2-epimerase (non-hydrolyzing) [Candidatus Uhrbacteria bacterium]